MLARTVVKSKSDLWNLVIYPPRLSPLRHLSWNYRTWPWQLFCGDWRSISCMILRLKHKHDFMEKAKRHFIQLFPQRNWFNRAFRLPAEPRILSGDRHAHFKVFCHRATSWIDVEWLVGIFTYYVMTKNALCQDKLASKYLFTANYFGFEKWNNTVGFLWYLAAPSGKDIACIILAF